MLTGDRSYGVIGGESVQHVLLARAWRDLGVDVSIVVYDHGQSRVTMVDGIRAVACYRQQAGIRMLRYVHPRTTSVLRVMREIDADAYYQSPAAGLSGLVALFAKRFGKRSIVRIASDSDCLRPRVSIQRRFDRWLYEYGVLNSSLVAAQTERQRALLAHHFGVRGEIVNIAVEAPAVAVVQQKDIDVLWVGNLRPVKRPDILLELARRRPQYRFALVGGSGREKEGKAYFSRIAEEAKALPNVTMTGAVPYQAVGTWFERSRLHVNTSDYEGFPNTFLQAWVRRVPVVSFFDPDGVIERRALGRSCGDIEQMCAAIDELLRNPGECVAIGERAYASIGSQYSAREVALKYLELLERPSANHLPLCARDESIRAAHDV